MNPPSCKQANEGLRAFSGKCPPSRTRAVASGFPSEDATMQKSSARRRGASLAPKGQIARAAALAVRLGLVARADETRPRQPPIIGALGGPDEIGRSQAALECPARIIGNIGHEAEFSARQQHPCDLDEARIPNEAPPPKPGLRPPI